MDRGKPKSSRAGNQSRPSAPADDSAADRTIREFSRSLPMALLRAREAVMGRFRPMLRDHDLTEQQWRVLRALTTAPEMRAGQLASVSFISMPSLSRILRILDDRGLILRRNEATDLRASLISLADDGAALIARIAPLSEAHYGEITDAYGPEALETLYRMLEDLTERLEVRPAERDDPGATT